MVGPPVEFYFCFDFPYAVAWRLEEKTMCRKERISPVNLFAFPFFGTSILFFVRLALRFISFSGREKQQPDGTSFCFLLSHLIGCVFLYRKGNDRALAGTGSPGATIRVTISFNLVFCWKRLKASHGCSGRTCSSAHRCSLSPTGKENVEGKTAFERPLFFLLIFLCRWEGGWGPVVSFHYNRNPTITLEAEGMAKRH